METRSLEVRGHVNPGGQKNFLICGTVSPESERAWLQNKGDLCVKNEFISLQKCLDSFVQRQKRQYWITQQEHLLSLQKRPSEFWKEINNIGNNSRVKPIPMEVVNSDGSIERDQSAVSNRWRSDFATLFKSVASYEDETLDTNQMDGAAQNHILNSDILTQEVFHVLINANKGKAVGSDLIPVEVLCNDPALQFLVCFFQKCFTSGIIPTEWSKGLIKPIPKSTCGDPRDPLMYRGITLTSKYFVGY